jgi:hypothetical protein
MTLTGIWISEAVGARKLNHSKGVVLQSNDKYCTSSYAGHVKITWPIFFFLTMILFHLVINYGLFTLVYITSLEK